MNIVDLITSSKLTQNITNGAGKEFVSRISDQMKIEKIQSIGKLIYSLFLYSVLGFFAKIITKLFKI